MPTRDTSYEGLPPLTHRLGLSHTKPTHDITQHHPQHAADPSTARTSWSSLVPAQPCLQNPHQARGQLGAPRITQLVSGACSTSGKLPRALWVPVVMAQEALPPHPTALPAPAPPHAGARRPHDHHARSLTCTHHEWRDQTNMGLAALVQGILQGTTLRRQRG